MAGYIIFSNREKGTFSQGGNLDAAIVEADLEAGLPNCEKGVWGGQKAVISSQLILQVDRLFT